MVAYIDDIFIGGCSRYEVWQRTQVVLQCLVSTGLIANVIKVTVMVKKKKNLGYEIYKGYLGSNIKNWTAYYNLRDRLVCKKFSLSTRF